MFHSRLGLVAVVVVVLLFHWPRQNRVLALQLVCGELLPCSSARGSLACVPMGFVRDNYSQPAPFTPPPSTLRHTPFIISPCCKSTLCNLSPWQSPAQGEKPRSAEKGTQKNNTQSTQNVTNQAGIQYIFSSIFELLSLGRRDVRGPVENRCDS